ncbi:MAG: hypothetical protein ACLU99_08025 [Alphaproteobacteria bacterium]
MDVQSKLQKLKKRLGLTAALSIAAMSASSAEQQDPHTKHCFPAAKETKVNTFTENDSILTKSGKTILQLYRNRVFGGTEQP